MYWYEPFLMYALLWLTVKNQKHLRPHAVDKLVICAVFNWLRGLEPLATTPWQQQQQQHSASGDQWNTIHRTGNQLGSRKQERLEDVPLLTKQKLKRIRPTLRRKVLRKVSISRNFSHIFRALCCVDGCVWTCVCLNLIVCVFVCNREVSWFLKNIWHYPSKKRYFLPSTMWPLMVIFCW